MSMRGVLVMVAQTLRARRATLIAWSLTLALLVVIYIAMFPTIERIDMEALIKQYPKELLRAFGFEQSALSLSTAIGFLNTELFGFMLPLAIVFLPVGVIVRMTSRAEERRYLESLLSAPLARSHLIAAAAITATLAMALPIVVMVVTALLAALVAGVELSLAQIGGSALSLLPMGALAGGVAVLVVGATRRHGVATAVAVGVVVAMYLMNVLAGLVALFDDIKGLTLFHYYSDWINRGISWPAFFAWLLIAAGLTVVGALLYERRDIG
jgi:ABC-2 type transport system permease protein